MNCKSKRSTFLTVLGYVKLHYPTRQDELLLCHSLESEAVTTFLKKRDIEERQTDRHNKLQRQVAAANNFFWF